MAAALRIEFSDAVYYISVNPSLPASSAGIEQDARAFADSLFKTCRRFHWRCYGYCYLAGQYQLLIKTLEPNLYRGLRFLNTLFGRYCDAAMAGNQLQPDRIVLVEQGPYILELARYMVLKPVRAHLVLVPEQWPWSSHRSLLGLCQCPHCINRLQLLSFFGRDTHTAMRRYKQFVIEGIDQVSPLACLKHELVMGSEKFLQDILALAELDLMTDDLALPMSPVTPLPRRSG